MPVVNMNRPNVSSTERAHDMATIDRDNRGADGVPQDLDPRDTDHPTGSKQAAENAAEDPPS
jgi:hypothetical protein